MREGSGLVEFEKRFPKRYRDVAICEQHAVTYAAGLACEGLHPVVAIYSTFAQRAYDQILHDVALQNLPVTFAVDRAGIVGADGATHHGAFDLAYLRSLPNMTIMAPSDEAECRKMLTTAVKLGTPAAVRYPRATGRGVDAGNDFETMPIGRARILRRTQKNLRLHGQKPLGDCLKVRCHSRGYALCQTFGCSNNLPVCTRTRFGRDGRRGRNRRGRGKRRP